MTKASSTDTIRCWNFLGERMKNILCFGDSNTFGSNPSGGRWSKKERWTGLLAAYLGEGYSIYEEGLGGRTTVFDDPLEPNRNGSLTLPVSLHSHRPLDLVILSLGTNDCKCLFNANPRVIAKGLEKLVKMVKTYDYGEFYPVPQVLVIAPIHIGEAIETSSFASFDQHSYQLSLLLGDFIKEMAQRNKVLFFDASEVAHPSSIDQLHMDKESHEQLSKALFPLVLNVFGDKRPLAVEEVSEDRQVLVEEEEEHDENINQLVPVKKSRSPLFLKIPLFRHKS